MALKGDLSEFNVEQVLRLLALSAQTGTLDVRSLEGKAKVEVTAGAVTNARGHADPEIALGRALLARAGTFAFTAGPTGDRALDVPLDELVERSKRRASEMAEVLAAVPDEDARFKLSERAMTGSSFSVGPDELKVLMEVGGGRSVREIRRRSKTAKTETAPLLYRLLQKGLIERTETEASVGVQVTGARRARRPKAAATAAPEAAAPSAPAAAVEPEIVPSTAAPAVDIPANELTDELDARLAALADVGAPPPQPAATEEQIVVTPSLAAAPEAGGAGAPDATVVFALHYMPATAEPMQTIAPPPKRRGLFDFVLKRPSAAPAEPGTDIDIPSAAALATLANELLGEYQRQREAASLLGSYAQRSTARSFEEALPGRLARVYSMRAVGSRIPVRGDQIDVEAVGGIAPARVLPYLALLVRDIRDEAIRAFGEDDARRTYEQIAARVLGKQVPSPTMILRHVEVPTRGRLRREHSSDAPFELRDRTYVIGRAATCELVVRDEKVSSRHAEVAPDVLGHRIRDLGSTNGTYVNEQRIGDARLLRGGEKIRVGDTTFTYERIAGA